MTARVTITLELDDEHARALATLMERCTQLRLRTLSVDDTELQRMQEAADQLYRAIGDARHT